MENQVILGSDLMLFKDGKAIACATSCKLDIQANTLETSSKDNGRWTSKQGGKLSWSATSDNLLVMSEYKSLVDAMIAREAVQLEFDVVSKANDDGVPTEGWTFDANNGYKGNAIITSISLTASDGDNATYSVSFEGTGALQPR